MLDYVPLWTFQDAIEYLLDCASATGTDPAERRKARRAVLDAYREFPSASRSGWTYFTRTGQVRTQASQNTGTVAYDHTGGDEERLCTLAGATVPPHGEWFRLVLGQAVYPIERVVDDTHFTLPVDQNPGADVSASSYRMYRSTYPVPINYRSGSAPVEFQGHYAKPRYATPQEVLDYQQRWGHPQSWPVLYTLRGGAEQYSGLVFEFAPPPHDERTYSFVYPTDPRPIGLFAGAAEYSTGTVSVDGTSVTGSGTEFRERMEGCVIRFPPSGSSTLPTGTSGDVYNDNPYAEYRIVQSVESTTGLTLDQATSGTYSSVRYTIGDPLDLDYHVMLNAFLALCRWNHAVVLKSDSKFQEAREAEWQRELSRSLAADYRAPVDQPRVRRIDPLGVPTMGLEMS